MYFVPSSSTHHHHPSVRLMELIRSYTKSNFKKGFLKGALRPTSTCLCLCESRMRCGWMLREEKRTEENERSGRTREGGRRSYDTRRKSKRVDRFRVARSLARSQASLAATRARWGRRTDGRMDGASVKALQQNNCKVTACFPLGRLGNIHAAMQMQPCLKSQHFSPNILT